MNLNRLNDTPDIITHGSSWSQIRARRATQARREDAVRRIGNLILVIIVLTCVGISAAAIIARFQ